MFLIPCYLFFDQSTCDALTVPHSFTEFKYLNWCKIYKYKCKVLNTWIMKAIILFFFKSSLINMYCCYTNKQRSYKETLWRHNYKKKSCFEMWEHSTLFYLNVMCIYQIPRISTVGVRHFWTMISSDFVLWLLFADEVLQFISELS